MQIYKSEKKQDTYTLFIFTFSLALVYLQLERAVFDFLIFVTFLPTCIYTAAKYPAAFMNKSKRAIILKRQKNKEGYVYTCTRVFFGLCVCNEKK
jgi:hypothetical protein